MSNKNDFDGVYMIEYYLHLNQGDSVNIKTTTTQQQQQQQ